MTPETESGEPVRNQLPTPHNVLGTQYPVCFAIITHRVAQMLLVELV